MSLDVQAAWDRGEEHGDAAADRFLEVLDGRPSVVHAVDVHERLLLDEGQEATEGMTSEQQAAYRIASMHQIGSRLLDRHQQA
jgi:hypothetical protein